MNLRIMQSPSIPEDQHDTYAKQTLALTQEPSDLASTVTAPAGEARWHRGPERRAVRAKGHMLRLDGGCFADEAFELRRKSIGGNHLSRNPPRRAFVMD